MLHIETPFFESLPLTRLTGNRVFLKMEALQPSGSFKIRGVGFACERYKAQGATRFICASGGNAGLAVAYAGRKLNIPTTILVPETTKKVARDLILLEGADVHVFGASWQEAHERAIAMVQPSDAYIHPFDDPLLWEGHATMIDEVAATGFSPDAVVVAVGGGGLLCGVMEGIQRNGWTQTHVFALETVGADSYAQSRKADAAIELPEITSIATSLGSKHVCKMALTWAKRRRIESMVVSDREAIEATRSFLQDHRVFVEPACGAALAPVYARAPKMARARELLVIVCGGVGIRFEDLLSGSHG